MDKDFHRGIIAIELGIACIIEAFQIYTSALCLAGWLALQTGNLWLWIYPLNPLGITAIVGAILVQICMFSLLLPSLRKHHRTLLLALPFVAIALFDVMTDYLFINNMYPLWPWYGKFVAIIGISLMPVALFSHSMEASSVAKGVQHVHKA